MGFRSHFERARLRGRGESMETPPQRLRVRKWKHAAVWPRAARGAVPALTQRMGRAQ